MRFSYSSFQAQIRRTSSSRPMSWRVLFSSLRSRVSTTAWVAIPAWSVPGIQRASYPCIRFQRIRMSWIVLLSAWPRCRAPVTLGGGMTIVYGGLALAVVGMEIPLFEPEPVPAVLGVLGVVLLGEFGGAHA